MTEPVLHFRLKGKQGEFAFNFEGKLPLHETSFIFGLSGSGKTTLLRCIAGLEKIKNGQLSFGDTIWQDEKNFVPTHQRRLAFTFQESSLFPHVSIQKNLEYGLQRTPVVERKVNIDDIIERFQLKSLLKRYAHELSGGQRQRVAIARALLSSPKLLLMDEPLANLDQTARNDILSSLREISANMGLTTLYVSHTIEEAQYISSHTIHIQQGKILTDSRALSVP